MEEELKSLQIKRSKYGVGKNINPNIWFHKDYISDFMPLNEYQNYINLLPENFDFNIIKFDTKSKDLSFIYSPNFDSSHEPIVSDSYKIKEKNGTLELCKMTKEQKDPLIYHHKWLFVKEDYKGFDIEESKRRSIEWKSVLGKNPQVTSKIGRLSFWKNWLKENKMTLENTNNEISCFLKQKQNELDFDKVWAIYTDNEIKQSIDSAKTARIQMPRSFNFIKYHKLNETKPVLLDIGCGSGNERFSDALKANGIDYNGCDPFNQPKEININSIKKCMNGNADIVTLNSVLNTIPEKEVWIDILKQAKNALNSTSGLLITVIYEGEKLAKEKKIEADTGKKLPMTPIETRDGWQNRMKAKEYLPAIKEVFPNSELVSVNGSKMIVSSKDPNLDLTIYNSQKQTNKIKLK